MSAESTVPDAATSPDAATLPDAATGPYAWPTFAPIFQSSSQLFDKGCNTKAYATTPNLGRLMFGRALFNDTFDGMTCPTGGNFLLTAVQISWASPTFNNNPVQYLYTLLDPRTVVTVDGHTLTSAYDATVTPYNGTYWMAFECALGTGIASSCVGPLLWDAPKAQFAIDLTRTSAVVTGVCQTEAGGSFCYSASVPKIVAHKGHLYLYWDAARVSNSMPVVEYNDYSGPTVGFISVNERAAELTLNGASNKMYAINHAAAITSLDDAGVVVLKNVDMAGVISAGDNLIATGALTQLGDKTTTCIVPQNSVANCYRLFLAQSQDPLGTFTLVPSEAAVETAGTNALSTINTADGLPNLAETYKRFVYRTDTRKTVLMGGLEIKKNAPPLLPTFTSPIFTWPDALLSPICDPEDRPYPNYMELNGACLPSCAVLGGKAQSTSCASTGMASVGSAYNTPNCCMAH